MQRLKFQILLLVSCLIIGQSIHAQKASKAARYYFSKVAEIIKNNYYFIDSIDFNDLDFKAKQYLSQSTNAKDTYQQLTVYFTTYITSTDIYGEQKQIKQ